MRRAGPATGSGGMRRYSARAAACVGCAAGTRTRARPGTGVATWTRPRTACGSCPTPGPTTGFMGWIRSANDAGGRSELVEQHPPRFRGKPDAAGRADGPAVRPGGGERGAVPGRDPGAGAGPLVAGAVGPVAVGEPDPAQDPGTLPAAHAPADPVLPGDRGGVPVIPLEEIRETADRIVASLVAQVVLGK